MDILKGGGTKKPEANVKIRSILVPLTASKIKINDSAHLEKG